MGKFNLFCAIFASFSIIIVFVKDTMCQKNLENIPEILQDDLSQYIHKKVILCGELFPIGQDIVLYTKKYGDVKLLGIPYRQIENIQTNYQMNFDKKVCLYKITGFITFEEKKVAYLPSEKFRHGTKEIYHPHIIRKYILVSTDIKLFQKKELPPESKLDSFEDMEF